MGRFDELVMWRRLGWGEHHHERPAKTGPATSDGGAILIASHWAEDLSSDSIVRRQDLD
jgi:hypothetical protein